MQLANSLGNFRASSQTYAVRSARVLTAGMTLSAWAAPTTISIWLLLELYSVSEHIASATHLNGSIIDKQAIQLLESLAGAVNLVESDIGNATADRVGAIYKIDSLDGSNSLDKVFLMRKRVSLSVVEIPVIIFESPSPILAQYILAKKKSRSGNRRELQQSTNE